MASAPPIDAIAREKSERARLCAILPRFGDEAQPALLQAQSERAGDWKRSHDDGSKAAPAINQPG